MAFSFTESWTVEDVQPWIMAIDGFIQCDDYKGYSSLVDVGDNVKHMLVPPDKRLGCMMHVRRRFHAALKAGHLNAVVPIRLIANMYKVEREAKEDGLFLWSQNYTHHNHHIAEFHSYHLRNLQPPQRLVLAPLQHKQSAFPVWPIWTDLLVFCKKAGASLDEFIVKNRFNLFD